MPFKDLSPEQQAMDKIIKSMNTKIRKIAEKFGTESRAYQQIYEILSGYNAAGTKTNRFSILSAGYTREDKNGIIQVSRSAKALADLEIKQYMKALKRVSQLPSAAQIEKNIVKAYVEANTTTTAAGKKIKPKLTREQKKQMVQDAIKQDIRINKRLESALAEVYKLQSKYGYEFKEMQDIKELSKGRFTSEEDLMKMIEIAERAAQDDDRQIQQDMFAGY